MSATTDAITATPSIVALFFVCSQSFARLVNCLQDSNGEFSDQISIPALEDELGRFRVWAGNVGAHRTGRVSLDHKLREASQVCDMVKELLKDLDDSLQEIIAIVSHERTSDEHFSSASSVSSLDDESEEEMDPATELQARFSETCHVITCMYRFTITIQSPAQRDRLQKCASIDVSHYEFFDIQHASLKFPGVEQFLLDRLGKANTRRRQLLLYHQKHHDTISQHLDLLPVDLDLPTRELPEVGDLSDIHLLNRRLNPNPSTVAPTVNTQTTVSTFFQGLSRPTDTGSDSGQTQTSYATSAADDTKVLLSVPPPPNANSALDGAPFQCPYCFCIVSVVGSHAWTKHVFRDLRPYVCTFRDCPKPDRLFQSRHDWYQHEVEFHRREWFCHACSETYTTPGQLKAHLTQTHITETSMLATAIDSVVDRCERAIGSVQACRLCLGEYLPQNTKGHLARHMQQLALFALPRTAAGDVESESGAAQGSRPNEQQVDGSFADSVGPDQASVPPSLNSSVVSQRESYPGIDEDRSEKFPRTEEGKKVIGALKELLGSEHPDTLITMTKLILAIFPDGLPYDGGEHGDPGPSKEWLNGIFQAKGLHLMWISQYGIALDTATRDGQRNAIDLLLTCADNIENDLTDLPAEIVQKIGNTYSDQVGYDSAFRWYGKVLAGQEKILGSDHPSTLDTVCDMAGVFFAQGRYDDALEWYGRGLHRQEVVQGWDHQRTLEIVCLMAGVFAAQGKYDEALEWYGRALAGREKSQGMRHRATLNTVCNMASIFRAQGRYDDSLEWYSRAVAGQEETLGSDNPRTLNTICDMADVFCALGKYDDALEWYDRALAGQEKTLESDHPRTLNTVGKIGDMYSAQNKNDAALVWYMRAVTGLQKTLGKEHPTTLAMAHKMDHVQGSG